MHFLARFLCLFLTLLVQIASGLVAQDHQFPYEKRDTKGSPCYNSAPGSICAAHGSLADPAPITGEGEYHAPNEVYCSAICRNSGQAPNICTSFSWDSKSQRCITFSKTLEQEGFERGPSNETHYDFACFNCIYSCPQPENQNVLVNSGFQQFANSIAPWQDTFPNGSVASPGFRSSRAYQAQSTEDEGDTLDQVFHTCPGTQYLLTFEYKYVFGSKSAVAGSSITIKIEGDTTIVRPTLEQNNTWVSHSSLFQKAAVSSGPSLLLIYPAVGLKDGQLFLDNIQASPVNPQVVKGAPNQITNPKFEAGNIKGWKSQACGIGKPGYKSNYAAKCTATSQAEKLYSLYQNVPTSLNKAYYISFDYKAMYNHKNNNCYLLVSAGRNHFVKPDTFGGLKNNTWYHYHHFTIADTDQTLLGLHPGDEINGNGYYCTFYFDNVKFKPATV